MKACPPTTFPQETMASQQRRIGPGGQAKARTRPAGRVILLDRDDLVLLGEIYRWTHAMKYDDVIIRQVERFFLARTELPEREIIRVEATHAADGIATWRWWTLTELDATAEAIWPAELPGLIRKTLT